MQPEGRARLLDMIGMRNGIAHGCVDIDLDLVWTTATERSPELLHQLRSIIGPCEP